MKKLLLLCVILLNISCSKEFVASFEQPNNPKLNNLKLEVFVDNEKLKEINLKTSSVISYETAALKVSDEGVHHLKIKVKDTTFKYEINYPKEKYILLSAYLKKNGKIHIGVLKQEREFIFH